MTDKAPLKIVKPSFLEKFKSKRPPTISGVETLLTALKLMRIAEVGDFVRLHPDEDNYWTCELCFVSVPIKGEWPSRTLDELIEVTFRSACIDNDKHPALLRLIGAPQNLG